MRAASMASVLARADGDGEGADVAGIDEGDGQAGRHEAGGDDGLEAAGGLDPDRLGREGGEAGDEGGDAVGVAGDGEGLSARADVDVEGVLGDVDADEGGVHLVPSLRKRASFAAQATVRVRWNGGRRPWLLHGLDRPKCCGLPAATAPASLSGAALR